MSYITCRCAIHSLTIDNTRSIDSKMLSKAYLNLRCLNKYLFFIVVGLFVSFIKEKSTFLKVKFSSKNLLIESLPTTDIYLPIMIPRLRCFLKKDENL